MVHAPQAARADNQRSAKFCAVRRRRHRLALGQSGLVGPIAITDEPSGPLRNEGATGRLGAGRIDQKATAPCAITPNQGRNHEVSSSDRGVARHRLIAWRNRAYHALSMGNLESPPWAQRLTESGQGRTI